MGLKLFHSTGYSSLREPGETRRAAHPARLVLLACLWVGVACNVSVWRLLGGSGEGLRVTLASAAVLAGGTAVFLGALGWRRSLRLAISVALLAGALFAMGTWNQRLPIEALWQGPPRTWLPAWTILLRWQVLVLLLALALVPIVWIWVTPLRRHSLHAQWRVNLGIVLLGLACLAAGIFLLP